MVTGVMRLVLEQVGRLQVMVAVLVVMAARWAAVAVPEDILVLGVLAAVMVPDQLVLGALAAAVAAALLAVAAVAGLVFRAKALVAQAAMAAQTLLILVEAEVQAGLLEVTVTVIFQWAALGVFMAVAVAVALLVIRVQQGVQPVAAQSVSFGPAQPVNSHRQTLGHLNF